MKTLNKRSLDDLAQALMSADSMTTAEFVQLAGSIIGDSSVVLDSKLFR
ncbi:hypothetical protein [Pseudomonas sp. MD330_11]